MPWNRTFLSPFVKLSLICVVGGYLGRVQDYFYIVHYFFKASHVPAFASGFHPPDKCGVGWAGSNLDPNCPRRRLDAVGRAFGVPALHQSRATFGNRVCRQYRCSKVRGFPLEKKSIDSRDSRFLGVKGHYTQITPR